jgi:hypothetical protein
MSVLDGLWHFLNFFSPAWGLGCIGATLTKLLWRHDLAQVLWLRLATSGAFASSVALLAGLIGSGRDGTMLTYGAMVLACALALWWAGWGSRRQSI